MVHTAHLNVDLGEMPDEPAELYALATVANVACGGHAGDATTMARAVTLCLRHGTLLAAHPSYPDRDGFGRRAMEMTRGALQQSLMEQLRGLMDVANQRGASVAAVKPHGALYHSAASNPDAGRAVLDAVAACLPGATLVGPPRCWLAQAAHSVGRPYWTEGFADRGYADNGTLVPRGQQGALIADPAVAAAQAVALARSGVHTICVHSDSPHAVALATAVRNALHDAGLLAEAP